MKHLDVYTLQFMSTLLAANTGGMAIVFSLPSLMVADAGLEAEKLAALFD